MNLLRNLHAPVKSSSRCLSGNSRWLDRSLSASLLLALGAAGVLWACGSSPKDVKQPEPVKVQWSKAGEADDETSSGGEDATPSGTEVDLDAPAKDSTKESAKEPAKAAAPPAPEPPPEEPKAEAPAEPAAEAPAAEAAAEEEAPAAESPAAEPPAAVPLGKEIRAAVRGKEPKEKPAKKGAKSKKAAASAPAAADGAPAAAEGYKGNDPCQAKSFSVARVEEACGRNGRSGAKSVMKEAIGKALAGGASLKCADCHSDLRRYGLKKDAVAQLKKWLGS